MITVGVDLAAEPRSTAAMRIDWEERSITRLDEPATDGAIVGFCRDADRIGIDCPFGWPLAFIEFVTAQRDRAPLPRADDIEARRPLAYRVTDLHCQQHHGLRPLSVSADRIAHAAFRCAGLLQRLAVTDRSGEGRAIETYPAGALRVWGLERKGYKRDLAVCHQLFDLLTTRLDLVTDCVVASDHELDALVCAIIARIVDAGFAEPVPDAYRAVAATEGWIALPYPDSLVRLAALDTSGPR